MRAAAARLREVKPESSIAHSLGPIVASGTRCSRCLGQGVHRHELARPGLFRAPPYRPPARGQPSTIALCPNRQHGLPRGELGMLSRRLYCPLAALNGRNSRAAVRIRRRRS
jgi:hypothetical protein